MALDPSGFLTWQRSLERRLSAQVKKLVQRAPSLGIDESTLLLAFGLIIGAAVGAAVVLFYNLINAAQAISLNAAARLEGVGLASIVLVTMLAFVLGRFIIRYFAHDSDGENIPDVMRAVVKRRAVIHTLPVAVKTAATGIVIGGGGSVGAEGPVAVAGSALGSKIGRFFQSGPQRLRVLVACGAAAGISAAFNAPIAGVFFSLEKIMGTMRVSSFPPVLVSSVIAAAISRSAFGNSPVVAIPTEYGVGSASELVYYGILGIVTGLVAVAYTRTTYALGDRIQRLASPWTQLLLAGLLVGGLNVLFQADLWGKGYESISLEVIGDRTALFLIGLAAAKIVATAVTLAAVRAGGVFTPALFIGATLAGGLGVLATDLIPGFTIEPEAFALVGMAGVVAGSTHAPLTAIMIVFEMTSDYALILPLMLCGAIAFITAKRSHTDSIYSAWLTRKGENITFGQDVNVMERLHVKSCFNADPKVVRETATVPDILNAIESSRQTEFPVVDSDLRFLGMITFDDVRTVMSQADRLAPIVVAEDLASRAGESVTPDDTLRVALQRIAVRGAHYIPVVAADDSTRLLGLLSRQDILGAYERELLIEEEQSVDSAAEAP